MSNYQQYLADKAKRDEAVAERQAFYARLPAVVIRELESREDQDTKRDRRAKSSLKARDVLLILERYDIEVTEAIFDQVYQVYG